MKNLKRILSVLLAAIMLVGTVPAISAATVNFTDVAGHWAWTGGQIPYLAEKEIINGIKQPNGTYMFKPDSAVTRAQFVKMIVETFGLEETADINYKDIKSSDWFYTHFQKAAAQGFLINYGNTVNPNGEIPREEAVALIVRYLDIPASEKANENSFTDYNDISSYYRLDVLQAVEAGIINGIKQNDGTYKFNPKSTLTRAQALTVIYKAAGCIYNKTAYNRDNSAFETNNVITTGGITISNVNFNGRNIITEGARSGKITLTNCKVNGTLYVRGAAELVLNNTDADNIVLLGGGKITFQNGSIVNKLNVEKTSDIALTSGTINELNVLVHAPNVKVTGTGTIKMATITASGFSAAMVPEKFDIAANLTAIFGSATYEGNSETANVFLTTPFASSDDLYYSVNVKTGYSGTIRLYYTNSASVPTNMEFDVYYKNSQFTDSFEVEANESTTNNTFVASSVSKFKYVVLQLVSGPTKYAPVVISNSVLKGNGFEEEPELLSTTVVSFVPEATGTVYWFYSDSGEYLNQAEFLEAYKEKESAFKGKISATSKKTGTLTLNSRYLSNYPFVVFMASTASGVNYAPVLLSTGENGFKEEPILSGNGVISYTPSVDGKIYYYLSSKATIPSLDEYYDIWKDTSTSLRNSKTVEKEVEDSFTFNTRYTEKYPYMIIAIEDDDNEFYTAFALFVNQTTGLKDDPKVDEWANTVTIETLAAGSVRYYYTNSSSLPNSADFSEAYTNTSKTYKGEVKVTSAKKITIQCNSSIVSRYPYLVIMFTDANGSASYPTIVNLGKAYADKVGFDGSPLFSFTDQRVTFSVHDDSLILYYFTNEENSGVTKDNFYTKWNAADNADEFFAYAGQTNRIDVVPGYKFLVMAHVYEDEATSAEIISAVKIVDLSEKVVDTTPLTGTGFTYSLVGANLFIAPKVNGVICYYFTNSTANFPKGNFQDAFTANGGKTTAATSGYYTHISCGDNYVVLCLKNTTGQYYNYVILDTRSGLEVDEDIPEDYGFTRTLDDILSATEEYKFRFTATVTGTITMTIIVGEEESVVTTESITAGSTYTIDFAQQVAILKNYNRNGTIRFQVTAGGVKYKAVNINSANLD